MWKEREIERKDRRLVSRKWWNTLFASYLKRENFKYSKGI